MLLYILVFTPFGNNLLKPYIQDQIDKHSPIAFKLNDFNISLNNFNFSLESPKCLNIKSRGKFSLFKQTIDGKLDITIDCYKNNNSVLVENAIKGPIDKIEIYTISNIGNGEARAYTRLNNFKLSKVDAAIDKVDIAYLLKTFTNNSNVNGLLNASMNIISKGDRNFTGSVSMAINNGEISKNIDNKINPQKIQIAKFRSELNADLNGETINHAFILVSSMGNIESSGITIINNFRTNSVYDINIHNLSPLSPVINMPLNGSFSTNGRIVGTYKWTNIIGSTNFASSNTSYNLSLKNYRKPMELTLQSKNIKLGNIFSSLNIPIYANGNANIDMSIKYLSDKLNGRYKHYINGYILKDNINKNFNTSLMNDIKFTNNTNIILGKGEGLLNSEINSDILNFNIKNAVLQIANQINIKAPYQLNINNLKQMQFITNKELNGSFKIDGEVNYKNNDMDISFISKVSNGKINGRYKNNIIDVNLLDIESLWLLDTLNYPRIFMSNINGKISYNTIANIGNIELILSKGRFYDSKLAFLLKKIANFNIKNEIYENIGIVGTFDKQQIKTNANLTSKNSRIEMSGTILNFKNDTIYSNISININKYRLDGIISGAIYNPNIKIDAKSFGKNLINNIFNNKR